MFTIDSLFLLGTGLLAAYLCWYFYQSYAQTRALHNLYYLMGFAVLLVSGLLLIFLGMGILASPYVLTVASLIPLGISMGLAEEYFPSWKKAYKWFALLGFLAIAVSSIGGLDTLKKIAVPLFHGVAGLVIFLGPLLAKNTPKGFWWVSVGGLLIGLGGIALAFITVGRQLLFFSPALVLLILTPLLFLMTGAYVLGFTRESTLTAVEHA
jgi:hypothetical protein